MVGAIGRAGSIFLAVSLLAACGEDEAPPKADVVRPAKIFTISAADSTRTLTFPGRTKASKEATLSFQVKGRLIRLPAKEGDLVRKDQELAAVDPEDYRLSLSEEEAKLRQIKQDLDRKKFLLGKGHVSKAEVDNVQRSFDVQEATVARARRNLDYATLRAPFDGTVARRYIDNFQNVQPNEKIFLLQDLRQIDIEVNIPEAMVAGIGQFEVSDAFATFEGVPGKRYPVERKEVATEADSDTQTYRVVVTMPAPKEFAARSGMTAQITIKLRPKKKTSAAGFKVPAAAVAAANDGSFVVWVYDPKNGSVTKRKVEVERIEGAAATVTGGIKEGEQIVSAGVNFLREGMKVRPMAAK